MRISAKQDSTEIFEEKLYWPRKEDNFFLILLGLVVGSTFLESREHYYFLSLIINSKTLNIMSTNSDFKMIELIFFELRLRYAF
jgi:hypothetical protein